MPAPKDPEKRKLWIERISKSHKGKPVWNTGLTKETDSRLQIVSDKLKDHMEENHMSKTDPEKWKEQLMKAMVEDANGTNGLWNIEAGWAIPDANAHYQVRFKVTDPTGITLDLFLNNWWDSSSFD